jgi:hypothetical protein
MKKSVALLVVASLAMSCSKQKDPGLPLKVEDFAFIPEVKKALEADYTALCDGSFLGPPAKDIESCRKLKRRFAAEQMACFHLANLEPDGGSSLEFQEQCLRRFGHTFPDGGLRALVQ